MSSATFIKDVSLGPYTVNLIIRDQVPLAECQGHYYNHIWLMSHSFPILSEHTYIESFAEISNFLWKGLQFQYIEDIAGYQKYYFEQVELERRYPTDVFPYRLTDYQLFDLSVMDKPRIENGNLAYFVYQQATGLPYRVVCPFPYESTSTLVHYQILPIKTETSKI